MTAHLTHFAINADDVDATRAFYEHVFDWTFTPYGPPGFFQIQSGTTEQPGVRGALQERRQLLADRPTTGFECTFAVDDLDDTLQRVSASGATLLMERFTISGVGHLAAFEDPGGNVVLAMQYDTDAD
ncbi:MAG: VOC family protein [Ilumatobacteraceae bacterium]